MREKHQGTKNVTSAISSLALHCTATVGAVCGINQFMKKSRQESIKRNRADEVDRDPMMRYVDENIIGNDVIYDGPFGPRKVVYCDYTASGKSVKFIEDYIRDEVLPYYGNTHTTTSVSSLRTTALRKEAKDIIRKSLKCTEEDAVIFVSSGTTGAIAKLIHGLKLDQPPILFISPYEHHSNILPWLELGAEVRIELGVDYNFTFGNFGLTVFNTDVDVRIPSFN